MSDASAPAPEQKPLCAWCGEDHMPRRCPYVKALEWAFNAMGQRFVSRIEYFAPGELTGMPGAEPGADYPTYRPMKD